MSISSLSSLATTAFDTAKSTLKAMAEAAAAPPGAATAPPGAAAAPPGAATAPLDAMAAKKNTAANLGLMTLDTLDTVDVSTAWTAAETPKATDEEKPARPRSRLGNSLDSYA